MKRTALTVAFLMFLSALLATVALMPETRGMTLYVGGGGPGNYTSIYLAVEDASPHSTVFVYSGTYYSHPTIDKPLTLIGENMGATVIDGRRYGDVVYISADWVNVTGFTIRKGGWNSFDAGVELNGVQHCHIYGNNVSDNGNIGILLDYSDNNTISENTVSLNVYGLYISDSRHNTVTDNYVSSNGMHGIYLNDCKYHLIDGNVVSSSGDVGILLHGSVDNTITRNEIKDNHGRGIVLDSSYGNTVRDNTLEGNKGDATREQFLSLLSVLLTTFFVIVGVMSAVLLLTLLILKRRRMILGEDQSSNVERQSK